MFQSEVGFCLNLFVMRVFLFIEDSMSFSLSITFLKQPLLSIMFTVCNHLPVFMLKHKIKEVDNHKHLLEVSYFPKALLGIANISR